MAKNQSASKTQETAAASEAPAPKPAFVEKRVKGIKNTLFADLAIGGSVLVGGILLGFTTKEGNYGAYDQFKGDFGLKVTEESEGETLTFLYRANTMYMPEVAADLLKAGFVQAAEEASEGTGVPKIEFKFKLVKAKDEDKRNARGYRWEVESLTEPAPERDKVLQLMG